MSQFVYPQARQDATVVEDYHGTRVADPYRWLEDPDSPESRAWIEAENKITFDFLGKIPEREKIRARLTELWNYERFGIPFREGGRYFITRNDGLQNQSVLYTLDTLGADPKLLLDPNKLSSEGTVALKGSAISEDGKLMAYGLSSAGSDWEEWKVREVATGKDLDDDLKWVKFSGASFTKDGKGFFYSRYDEPTNAATNLRSVNYFQKLYYHVVGTPQSEDILVYHRPDQKEWGFGGEVSEDGEYLIISISQGTDTRNRLFFKPLKHANGTIAGIKENKVVELIPGLEANYNFVANDGGVFYLVTDLNAPRSKLISIDTANPAKSNWKTIIPESKDTLRGVNLMREKWFAHYMQDAKSAIRIFKKDGSHDRDVLLPGIGSVGGFGGKRDYKETFYAFTSFTRPTTIYRYDVETGESTVYKEPKVKFSPDDYETKQIFYNSKDGARVPMFISHKKGLKLDGNNPTLLYAYGGFNISLTPSFSPAILTWMEMGGVYAQPNLRGGGEYGEEWHQAGMKSHKQNVFDDFIGAAEWLIANKYTRTPKLAINGGSNGGLLVGACMTQRPDLYGACLPAVGVMDMLRFHKFTIGWAWVSDYGSAENREDFPYLYRYSPLHNIKPGTKYPATLITTADHDDRVVPAHSFKFAAALQAAQAGPAPTLIRIETKAGHGAGKPTAKVIEEAADRYAFLVKTLDVKVK
ncbi:MAG TPA: prolyl oligopeptidase family serine peptidase [Verrucomicrobiae bacterium]|nr:prolyl oligopeptidase family serine peptidase [Verrucomicrobiae bacterium]